MPALGSDHSRDTAACNCSRGNTIKLKTNKQTNKQGEIQSLGERTRIRGDVFKREGIHFFPFLFHFKSRNWLSVYMLTVISDAV